MPPPPQKEHTTAKFVCQFLGRRAFFRLFNLISYFLLIIRLRFLHVFFVALTFLLLFVFWFVFFFVVRFSLCIRIRLMIVLLIRLLFLPLRITLFSVLL